jgi:hypothetical protein
MIKIGLVFQMISFLLFFWDVEIRTLRPPEKGGGFCNTPADKEFQLERVFSFIPWEWLAKFLSKQFNWISAGLFIVGTFLQVIG